MSEQRLNNYRTAIIEALAEEMRRDKTIVLMGEDVAEAGTTFKVLKGLCEEFGTAVDDKDGRPVIEWAEPGPQTSVGLAAVGMNDRTEVSPKGC